MGDPVTMAMIGGGIGAATSDDPIKGALLGAAGGYAGGHFMGGAGGFGGAASGATNPAIAGELMKDTAIGGALSGTQFVNPLTTSVAQAQAAGTGAGLLSGAEMMSSPLLPATAANQAATAAVPEWLGGTRRFFDKMGDMTDNKAFQVGSAMNNAGNEQPQPQAPVAVAPTMQRQQARSFQDAYTSPATNRANPRDDYWLSTAGMINPYAYDPTTRWSR